MPEYLAPGVYVEEVATGPRPIEGVSTSTTGFAGETERGPLRPRLVTSWEDYQQWYGGYTDRDPFRAANPHLPYAVRGFFDNGGQRLFVARVVGGTAANPAAQAALTLNGAGGNTILRAVGPGLWGNEVVIAVKDASLKRPGTATANWFRIQALYYRTRPTTFVDPTDQTQLANPNRRTPDVFEDFDNLSADPTDANFAMSLINGASRLIEVVSCLGVPNGVAFPTQTRLAKGGPSPYVAPVDTDFIGSAAGGPEDRTGIEGLCAIRDISIMAVPSTGLGGVRDALLDRCDGMKDRFAIVDQDDSTDFGNMRPPRDSSYAATYYPQVLVSASHTPEGSQYVPAAGHVAGIYARTDVDRGVHKAPANEVLRGIITRDLSNGRKPLRHTLNKREQDILNPKGVNVVRDFRPDGRDIRVWGARTMTSDSMWRYVSVRRLFIMLEQSIDRGTQWAVFEPNSEPTWIAVRTSIANFLRTVWRNGALMGTTEEEAFFVRCDRTTMTQDDFDNGRLICLIGVAPVKPAEFVIFRISQKTLESES
jgi:phage tail sheath protein FI